MAGADADARGGAEEGAVAMRCKRASRYWTYSLCSASQRSFESVRNPALRASSSSGDGSSWSLLGLAESMTLPLFSGVRWYGK